MGGGGGGFKPRDERSLPSVALIIGVVMGRKRKEGAEEEAG